MQINGKDNVTASNSLAVKLAAYQRRRMFARSTAAGCIEPADTLPGAAMSSGRAESSNLAEACCGKKDTLATQV
jgi:hypothetical protein